MHVGNRTCDAARSINISQRRILPARYKDWEILMRSGDHPTVSRVDLVELLKSAFPQDPIAKFVGKSSLLLFPGARPFLQSDLLDPSLCILLRKTSLGHSIQMALREFFPLLP